MTETEDSSTPNEAEKVEPEPSSTTTKEEETEDKTPETNEKTEDKTPEINETTEESDKTTVKRDNPESNTHEEESKRQKSVDPTEFSFLDVLKTVVKDEGTNAFGTNVLTNTKEYDCPIAKLAKMDPGKCFFKMPRTVDPSTDANSAPENSEEEKQEQPEKEEEEEEQVQLESSMSENEKLLHEVKNCKLSAYKNSEWSTPVPVLTHLILDTETFNKRVVCFQQGTGKLLLNTILLPSMSFNKLKTKSIIFTGRTLGSDSEFIPHRLVFPDGCIRDEFHQFYNV